VEELQVTLVDAQKAVEMARKYVCQFDIKYSIVTMCSRLESELYKLKAQ
jgi:NTP pyrophosphatase (non-canonical NTP hydrolase)